MTCRQRPQGGDETAPSVTGGCDGDERARLGCGRGSQGDELCTGSTREVMHVERCVNTPCGVERGGGNSVDGVVAECAGQSFCALDRAPFSF